MKLFRRSRAATIMLALLLLLPLAKAARAADAEAQKTFDDANQFYEKGQFDEALTRYEALAKRGFGGTALFYNLGNVHYRHGERGRAILWYERAERLSPRDSDVRFNLSLARSHIKSGEDTLLDRALTYFTENELSLSTTALSTFFFVLIGLLMLGKIKGDWAGLALIASGSMLIVSGAWLGFRIYVDRQPAAIVVSPPGEVRNGPGNDYAVGFTVPEGSRVVILNRRPDWTQVGVPEQGLKGWMPANEVEPITSRAPL